jgi:hypothetical protein
MPDQELSFKGFLFAVNDESIPSIKSFLENEIRERSV